MSRREDFRLVAGEGRYTSDWSLPGELHAVVLWSDRAHAEILRLDAAQALALPGVKTVLTGEDVRAAGFKSLPNVVGYPGKNGRQMVKPHHPVLALGHFSLITLLLLSGCGTQSFQTHQTFYGPGNALTGTNYVTFEHAFTDAGAEDARRRAEAQCQQKKKTAVRTEGRCTLQSCITSFQCMDADEAAAYQGEARK